jgi:hypothetical protein
VGQDSNQHPASPNRGAGDPDNGTSEQLTLLVDRDLFRAFQRCTWIIVHDTGRPRIEIMNEMVRDFLIKHGC